MNAEENARALCVRAIATDEPDQLDEILAQLSALLGEHIAIMAAMIEERLLRVGLENPLEKSA